MTHVRLAGAVALGAAIWFLVLVLHHPNLHYGSVEIECQPVLGFGNDDLQMSADRHPADVHIVRGEDEVFDLQLAVMDSESIEDESFVRRQLAVDCANRRTTLLGWSFLPAVLFTLGAVGCGSAVMRSITNTAGGVREWGPRSPENWRDLP